MKKFTSPVNLDLFNLSTVFEVCDGGQGNLAISKLLALKHFGPFLRSTYYWMSCSTFVQGGGRSRCSVVAGNSFWVRRNRYLEGRNDRQMTPRGYPNFNSYVKNLCVLVFRTDGQKNTPAAHGLEEPTTPAARGLEELFPLS
jgi:hypothetical protein